MANGKLETSRCDLLLTTHTTVDNSQALDHPISNYKYLLIIIHNNGGACHGSHLIPTSLVLYYNTSSKPIMLYTPTNANTIIYTYIIYVDDTHLKCASQASEYWMYIYGVK